MSSEVLPSARRLWKSTAIAALVAGVVVVTVVLPAEYGIDPTGVGKVLGLTRMAQAKELSARLRSGGEVMHAHSRKFHAARVEIDVRPREELEYKAQLAKGETLLYAWSVQGGAVEFEFHGEPTEGTWPEGFFQSYQTGARSEQEQGSFVAPFTGRHGWYWRNLGDEPIKIVIEAQGYFTKLGRVD